ncbi:MAG: hypothetical protein RLY69_185, partial [Verrucomicrobiota bacterium]
MKCLICRIGGWMGRLILTILLLLASLWAFGALWLDFPLVEIRPWAAGAFGLLIILWSALIRP